MRMRMLYVKTKSLKKLCSGTKRPLNRDLHQHRHILYSIIFMVQALTLTMR